MEDNKFYVIDEEGNEIEMEIVLTFSPDEGEMNYVLYTDPTDEENNVFAARYDDEGNLMAIETDAEWDMVEEVLGAFEDEQGY